LEAYIKEKHEMMNSKTTLSRTTILWSLVAILIVAGVITLIYSFSGGQADAVTEVNAVYTNAAATLAAQQQTLQAAAPSATTTPSVTPTTTITPLVSPTLSGLVGTFSTATLSGAAVTTCDNSVYLSDVTIPDNTAVNPGQAFTKTWKVSNTGTCTWNANYQIILISGDAMSGKSTPIGVVVAPGQSVDVSVAMVAPSTNGTVQGTWRLQNDKSQPFGTVLTVVIKVGGTTGATATKTATGAVAAPTATATATTGPTAYP
jgi:hypothetical protein